MSYNEIEFKKPFYKIKPHLREHLKLYSRLAAFPISYDDLSNHGEIIPLTDKDGKATFWNAVLFHPSEMSQVYAALLELYRMLYADGSPISFLKIGSVDFCWFGNSKPFRVKVVNELNDNHDYFYVKRADASRIYGLELEHIFSPNKMGYLVDKITLIEEHVVGIPADDYIKKQKSIQVENRLRLAKEFVKFNERCYVQLLGDMRAYNFVVEITQDFDNIQYRLRAMDFDQQCYEGRKNMYLPQFYKDNIELVKLTQEVMSIETAEQYVMEERAAMKKRFLSTKQRTKSILRRMRNDQISSPQNVQQLAIDLAEAHDDDRFLTCKTMGDILIMHLEARLGIVIF
jgi:hypothetical protein